MNSHTEGTAALGPQDTITSADLRGSARARVLTICLPWLPAQRDSQRLIMPTTCFHGYLTSISKCPMKQNPSEDNLCLGLLGTAIHWCLEGKKGY